VAWVSNPGAVTVPTSRVGLPYFGGFMLTSILLIAIAVALFFGTAWLIKTCKNYPYSD